MPFFFSTAKFATKVVNNPGFSAARNDVVQQNRPGLLKRLHQSLPNVFNRNVVGNAWEWLLNAPLQVLQRFAPSRRAIALTTNNDSNAIQGNQAVNKQFLLLSQAKSSKFTINRWNQDASSTQRRQLHVQPDDVINCIPSTSSAETKHNEEDLQQTIQPNNQQAVNNLPIPDISITDENGNQDDPTIFDGQTLHRTNYAELRFDPVVYNAATNYNWDQVGQNDKEKQD